jgi:hypothetical protein
MCSPFYKKQKLRHIGNDSCFSLCTVFFKFQFCYTCRLEFLYHISTFISVIEEVLYGRILY